MDDRSVNFLGIMIAIAVVGVLAFALLLILRQVGRPAPAAGQSARQVTQPQWYEFLLALVLLVAIAAVVVWQLLAGSLEVADWRGDPRSTAFFIVMLVLGGIGIVGFLIYQIAAAPRRQVRAAASSAPTDQAPADAGYEVPSAVRLLGLLLFLLALLLLGWIYLPAPEQYALMHYLLYPASLGVALVLLFDKASRTWNVKAPAETVREWLLCDAVVFLLVLGFLNLRQSADGESYSAFFWDLLFVAAGFLVFWIMDRKATRYRFLLTYGFLILVPVLLEIWRAQQGVAVPEDLSWWSSIWPFFILAIIFFVLEIIVLLVPATAEQKAIPAVKDALFVVLYGVLLVAAIPEAAT